MEKSIRQVIGGNVAMRRTTMLDETQAEFGQRIGRISGAPWSVKAVSETETGRRALTADDVLLLARALGTPPGSLYLIPSEVERIRVSDTETIPKSDVQDLAIHPDSPDAYLHEYATAAAQWRDRVKSLREEVADLQRQAGVVYASLSTVTETLKSLSNDAQDIHAQAAKAGTEIRRHQRGTAPEVGTI